LNQQIRLAEKGQLKRVDQTYPPELEKLKNSINHLLDSEQQQRTRYKNSLSDLAHSLKTPLAVLSGNTQLPEDAKDPLQQIDNQIQRQLKRAVAGASSAFEQNILLAPVADKLVNAMGKVYADKNLDIQTHIQEQTQFKGDMTDLMEILGNLIDNACKAARGKVQLTATQQEQQLSINVDDDGQGIPEDKRHSLLQRGTRLDSYKEGQGIGMAVVTDLVSAYQGKLEISDSTLGGACIKLTFPIS
jgi:two-component system sensor histidine kinase PhoQ